MRRIALALLAAVAVIASIGPASAGAVNPLVTPSPGQYQGTHGRITVKFRLTQQGDIVGFSDGTPFTADDPTPVASLRREDPKEVAHPHVWFRDCAAFCIEGFWKTPTEAVGKYWPPGKPDFNRDFEVELEKAPSK